MVSPGEEKKHAIYRIIVAELLDERWSEWFDGFSITPIENRQTELAGAVPDQAALHSVLARIRDLGLTLISLQRVE